MSDWLLIKFTQKGLTQPYPVWNFALSKRLGRNCTMHGVARKNAVITDAWIVSARVYPSQGIVFLGSSYHRCYALFRRLQAGHVGNNDHMVAPITLGKSAAYFFQPLYLGSVRVPTNVRPLFPNKNRSSTLAGKRTDFARPILRHPSQCRILCGPYFKLGFFSFCSTH